MKRGGGGAFTCKVAQLGKAPKRITLLGDRSKPESAQHVIEFPGGAIEVSRTSDGEYWAHIIVNTGDVVDDAKGLVSARGEVIDARLDDGAQVHDFDVDLCQVRQIAVLIKRAP